MLAAQAPILNPESIRQGFLIRFNQERTAAGLAPLRLVEVLNQVAQESAEQIRASGAAPFEETSLRELRRRLARAGYEAHGWSQSFAGSPGDIEEVFSWWKESNPYAFGQLLDGDFQELGVGVSDLDGTPLYTFLLAWRESEFFARQIAPLADLDEVRRAMLARVNAERAAAGASPLVLNPRLNEAAQSHAVDMLARSYYAHESPEGSRPRTRVEASGYGASMVGENIARGPLSVDEAVEGWLRSSEHRRNLLHPAFSELGVGLAIGKGKGRDTTVWVQNFGRPGPR
jgi:uncharacterized protein YkwD